jgi:hypothetical protein
LPTTTTTVDVRFRSTGGKKVKNDVRGIRNSLKGAAAAAKSLAGPIAGIGAAFVFARAAKEAMNFHGAMSRLAIQARVTAGEQAEVTQSILDTSKATGVARDDLQKFLKSVTDMTGDFGIATSTMEAVARASVATGADMQGLGFIVSDLSGKFNLMGDDASDALGVMIAQGEMGRLTLEEMARIGPEVMSVAGLAGLTGEAGVREMGAFLQVMRRGFGTAEKTATGFRSVIQRLTSSEGLRKLDKFGIDPTGFQDASGALTDFRGLFLSVLQKSTEDARILADVFGEQALAAAPFQKLIAGPGGIKAVEAELDKFMGVQADTTAINDKFGQAMQDGSNQAARFKARMVALGTETFFTKGSMDNLGTALDNLATGIEGAVVGIQRLGEGIAILAESLGLDFGPTAGQTAAGTRQLTPEQFAVRQTVLGIAETGRGGAGVARSPAEEAYLKWIQAGAGDPGATKSRAEALRFAATASDREGTGGAEDIISRYTEFLKNQQETEIRVDVQVHGAPEGATVTAQDKKSGKITPPGGAK